MGSFCSIPHSYARPDGHMLYDFFWFAKYLPYSSCLSFLLILRARYPDPPVQVCIQLPGDA